MNCFIRTFGTGKNKIATKFHKIFYQKILIIEPLRAGFRRPVRKKNPRGDQDIIIIIIDWRAPTTKGHIGGSGT